MSRHDLTEDAPLPRPPRLLHTPRLLLRPPQAGDGPALNASVLASIDALARWMPWAQKAPSQEESEAFCLQAAEAFDDGYNFTWLFFDRATGAHIGSCGLHRIRWHVLCAEIGYWCRTDRTRQGLATEVAGALTQAAFDALGAKRVEIRMDRRNTGSRRVAERLGFTLEGVLRHHDRDPQGDLRDTCIYARITPPPDPDAPLR